MRPSNCGNNVFLWLHMLPNCISVDAYGSLFGIMSHEVLSSSEFRLVSMKKSAVTALWDYPDHDDNKMKHYVMKW